MSYLEEFNELKELLEDKQSEVDRAKGSFSSIMEDLEKEHGVSSLSDAKKKLEKQKKKEAKDQKAYEDGLAQFKEKYGDELGL